MDTIIKIESNLTFEYSNQLLFKIDNNNLPLLVEQGKIYGIYGPNGSGKSTFINLLNGFVCQSEGEIIYYSQNKVTYILNKTNFSSLFSPIIISNLNGGIRRIFQKPSIASELNLIEALISVRRNAKKDGLFDFLNPFNLIKGIVLQSTKEKNEINEAINLLLEFGFLNTNKKISELSFGQIKLISVLQMLFSKASLILLDEPFSNIYEDTIRQLILKLKKYTSESQGTNSIIIIEHKRDYLEELADEIWTFNDKKIMIENKKNGNDKN
ncbi:MAG: ABC-F family ATP-binding cassette domain-containing protein [Bacteroidetes bacterium]|nr:MAG: ABC-F family ATP-binding cassette domain-containing protein [Bacteroidota bacterium]